MPNMVKKLLLIEKSRGRQYAERGPRHTHNGDVWLESAWR